MWGREDSNRVDISFDNGRVNRVMLRVDVRRLDSKFGAVVIALVRKANAVLIRGDGLLVEPASAPSPAPSGARTPGDSRMTAAALLSKYSADDEDAPEE